MRRIRKVLSSSALAITTLGLVSSQAMAAHAVIPHVASPSVTLDAAVGVGNGGIVTVTSANLTGSYNYIYVKLKCSGTHSAITECYNSQIGGTLAADMLQWSQWTSDGSTFSATYSIYSYDTGMSRSIYFPGLVNGVSYSATVKLNSGSESSALTFTAGDGAPTNVTITPTAPADSEGQYGCYFYCYASANGVASGSQVQVSWTPGTNTSFSYLTYGYDATQGKYVSTSKTYTATGYAVAVVPKYLYQGGTKQNAMWSSDTSWLFQASTMTASQLASNGWYGGALQVEPDGCTTLDSGGSYYGPSLENSLSAFSGAWYVDGISTSSVTLNGCHFARDESYIAIVTPVYAPQSLIDEYSTITTNVPFQWDTANKVLPLSGLIAYGRFSNQTNTISSPMLPSASSPEYLADGSAGNLDPELGSVSNVSAEPASTTDHNQRGTLVVSWTPPTKDLYFNDLTYDVSVASTRGGYLPRPPRVTTREATTPTKYVVTAIRQDASSWFGWLGWNGLSTKLNDKFVSCTAIAPATSCTLSGLATWTKYYVTVQAESDKSAGWSNYTIVDGGSVTGSTIWPQAPSKPLNITASNPTPTSTTLAWDPPTSIGGPNGVTISGYTAAMVPQFTTVKTLTTYDPPTNNRPYYMQKSLFGLGVSNSTAYMLDAMPGQNGYVGFLGYDCGTNPDTNLMDSGNGESCYNVFDKKGILYQYQLIREIKAANVANKLYDASAYKLASINFVHSEKWGYVISASISSVQSGSQRTLILYVPFVSSTATWSPSTLTKNQNLGWPTSQTAPSTQVPGGFDFSKIMTVSNTSSAAGTYGSISSSTNEVTDARMTAADKVLVMFVSTSDVATPQSVVYPYTLDVNSGTASKGANPVLTLGCYSAPNSLCTDWSTLQSLQSNSAPYPVTSFSVNEENGAIYFSTPWSTGGGNNLSYLTQDWYRTTVKSDGTYNTPVAITVDGSSAFGCYYICGGGLSIDYSQYNMISVDSNGNVSLPGRGGTTLYTETSAGLTSIAGTTLPLQSYDWWYKPGWIGGYYGGIWSVTRLPNGTVFAQGQRWTGDPKDQASWYNWSTTLQVMLDTNSHTCTTTGARTCTMQGTVQGAAYAITVYATNKEAAPSTITKDGPAGDFTNVIAGLPNSPRYASATITGSGPTYGATVTFQASLAAGATVDTSVTKYTCTLLSISGNQVGSPIDVTPPAGLTPTTNMTCNLTGLSNNTSYIVMITASNADGESYPASAPPLVVATPPAPQGVKYDTTVSPANLSWSNPGTGTTKVTFYTTQPTATPGNGTNGTAASGVSCTVSGSQCTPTGLQPNTTYYALVCTTNSLTPTANATTGAVTATASGSTTYSNCTVVSFTTSGTFAPDAPTNVSASLSGTDATVTWDAPGSDGGAAITDYTVQYSSNGGVTWQTATCTGTSTSCTVTGLNPGDSYIFKVAATNSVGTGSYSSNSSSLLVPSGPSSPDAPTNVSATAGDGQVTVTWTAPTNDGGSAITGYSVQYSSDGGSTWQTASCSGTATSCTITGLTNGTGYIFKVAATNSLGTGSYSSNSSTATPQLVLSEPGAPTLGTVTSTDTSITANWTAPGSNGGSTITGYTVTVTDPSGNVVGTCTSTGTSCTVSPLTPGIVYTVSLTATNAQGTSTAATKTMATKAAAGAKAKRFYIRRYHKGQMGVRGKQIKDIRKAVAAIVKSGATTIRITGWTNTGAKKIRSKTRAINVTKVVTKELARQKATYIQVTTVGAGGTKQYGGTVLNRVVVIRGK